jgi:hypothetical protein
MGSPSMAHEPNTQHFTLDTEHWPSGGVQLPFGWPPHELITGHPARTTLYGPSGAE